MRLVNCNKKNLEIKKYKFINDNNTFIRNNFILSGGRMHIIWLWINNFHTFSSTSLRN